MNTKHLVIVAGEASGDLHAATLLTQLKQRFPDRYEVTAIGGRYLAEAGATLLYDLAKFGVAGISEVLRHAWKIRQAYKKIQMHLTQHPPDLLILVDYPGFNLRLAKFAKTVLKLKILYYISPQVWAWKANRIHLMKQYIDHMAVILPFEKPIYDQAGIPCTLVEHPLLPHLPTETMRAARQLLGLPTQCLMIALLPGSRQHEINRLLPILLQAGQRLMRSFPTLQFVLPVAHTITKTNLAPFLAAYPTLPVTLVTNQAALAMIASDAVVVASGTASLECALLAKPMCIIYRASLLTYLIARRLIKVKYLGLCNLIANKMIVPELLQSDCTAPHIAEIMTDYLTSRNAQKQASEQLCHIKTALSTAQVGCDISEVVHRQLLVH